MSYHLFYTYFFLIFQLYAKPFDSRIGIICQLTLRIATKNDKLTKTTRINNVRCQYA